jgi:predicted MFS family arabinose efflux permease
VRRYCKPTALQPGAIVEINQIESFTRYQKFVIAILAFLQFTVILDFMIISPLGAMIMPALDISPTQFGVAVSAYAFSAGTAGLLAAGFADRYDRKKMLLFFYTGFVIGTFLCGVASSYHFLLFARIVTGIFGGVIGSIVFAITTDLFSFSMRGRVMGFVQTAFAASQILGIPVGLYLSNHWGWHAPFLMIVIVSILVGIVIVKYLQPIDLHLQIKSDRSVFHHLVTTITTRRYMFAFAATALLSLGGFMIMPFSSTFIVNNVGVSMSKLPLIYLISGGCSIFIGPLVGRASDRYGKFPTFVFGSVFGAAMAVVYTNMGVTPLHTVILINVLMFVGIFSRMIPSQALMSAVPEAASRGSFMSISSSLQQIAGGLGSVVAGLVVVQRVDGFIEHFDILGYILVGTTMITMFMVYHINRMVMASPQR